MKADWELRPKYGRTSCRVPKLSSQSLVVVKIFQESLFKKPGEEEYMVLDAWLPACLYGRVGVPTDASDPR